MVKTKRSTAILTGHDCDQCNVQTVTYDGTIAEKCINCEAPKPKRVWQDVVENVTVVKTIPREEWTPAEPPPGSSFSKN